MVQRQQFLGGTQVIPQTVHAAAMQLLVWVEEEEVGAMLPLVKLQKEMGLLLQQVHIADDGHALQSGHSDLLRGSAHNRDRTHCSTSVLFGYCDALAP